MKGLLVALAVILVMIAICVVFTPRYGPYDNTDIYKPFPGLTLSIHKSYIYDEKRIVGTMKDKECVITIDSTDNNSYRVEFWQTQHRAKDRKAQDASLDKTKTITLNMVDDKNRFINFHRIECYASINGKLVHKTIKHKFFKHW